MNTKITTFSLAACVAIAAYLSGGVIGLHAQSTGRYELLDQDQIVRELMRKPNVVVAPNEIQQPQQSNTTTTNIIVVNPVPINVLLSRYDILVQIPSITLSRLTFKSGSSQLTDESARSLGRLSGAIHKILSGSPNEIFLIEGHTDFPGSQEANERLSTARAKAVYDFLVYVGGIPSENLLYHGFGSSQLAIKTSKAAVSNRRVEIRRITSFIAIQSQPPNAKQIIGNTRAVADCGQIGGSRTATVVVINFDTREAHQIRNIWLKLDAVSNDDLVEANAAFLRYQVQLSNSGCRFVEELEQQLSRAGLDLERTIRVTLRGSVVRIERH